MTEATIYLGFAAAWAGIGLLGWQIINLSRSIEALRDRIEQLERRTSSPRQTIFPAGMGQAWVNSYRPPPTKSEPG